MRKFFYKLFFFFSFFFLLLALKQGLRPYYAGNDDFSAKLKQFESDSIAYNTVIFGSSRMYRHLNPILLDSLVKSYDLNTYNLATIATSNPESYYLYEKFLQDLGKNNLQYVLLELSNFRNLNYPNALTPKGSYYINTEIYLNAIRHYIESSNTSLKKRLGLIRNYTLGYIYRWLDVAYIFKIDGKCKPKHINGYLSLDKEIKEKDPNGVLRARNKDFISDTSGLSRRLTFAKNLHDDSIGKKLNSLHLKRVKELIELSKEKNIHLIFVIPPRLDNYQELMAIYERLPKENIVEVADYEANKELYTVENSFDIGHLNERGAFIFTEKLANKLDLMINDL